MEKPVVKFRERNSVQQPVRVHLEDFVDRKVTLPIQRKQNKTSRKIIYKLEFEDVE